MGQEINPVGIPFSLLMVVAVLGFFAGLPYNIKRRNIRYLLLCYTGGGLFLASGVPTALYLLGLMEYEPLYLLMFDVGSLLVIIGKGFHESKNFKKYEDLNKMIGLWIFITLFSIAMCIIM